jgi:hypothetical protein
MQPTCCAPLPDVDERAAELRYLRELIIDDYTVQPVPPEYGAEAAA